MTMVLMTTFALCLSFSAWTAAFLIVPLSHRELRCWRRANVRRWRHWITRLRDPDQPLDPSVTMTIARRILLWHLGLTLLGASQAAYAACTPNSWWRPLAAIWIVPGTAYFLGSIVQRQKLAILKFRARHKRDTLFA
jgi:hypothetical protein